MQRDLLELLKRIANALALQFGTNCEVVIHDLTGDDPENTIACIENGHVSKRDAKAGPSRIVLDAMREGRRDLPDHYNYLTKTNDGRILRSSSVYIKDESGKATGIFCINYDLTDLMMAQSVINNFVQRGGPGKEPERIPTNVNELLDDLLEKSVQLVGKPVAMMNKDDKVRAIAFLNEAGALLITKSGDKIAKYFGISKYSLYAYLDSSSDAK